MGLFDAPRAAGREHTPVFPAVYRVLRAVILSATLVALGLNAYALSYLAFSGSALMMFVCVVSAITAVYFEITYFFVPAGFNYWALLGLDIVNVVFWLVSFALLASQAVPLMSAGTECYYSYCYDYGLYGSDLVFAQCLTAASGVGGLCFVLYAVVLVFDSFALARHRAAGYHCKAGASRDLEKAAASVAQPVAMYPQGVVPVTYYEKQATQQQPPPSYASAPTPVSYVQSPADSSAGAYYAQQQQARHVPTLPAQYYEAAAAPVQTQK